MFWNVADCLAKLHKQENQPNHELQSQYEEVWLTILGKLINFCSDSLSELRHSALHIFSSIIIHHGQMFR